MRKALIPVAIAVVAGLALGGGLMTAVQLPKYSEAMARLRAVQAYLASSHGWSLEQAKEFMAKVDQLEPPEDSEAVQVATSALQKLAEFERKYIPFPVIYANQAAAEDLLGKKVILYGTVARVNLTDSGHLFVSVGDWTVIKWGAQRTPDGLEAGKAIAAVGTVKVYQGKYEVVVDSLDDIVF